eukprot:m.40379 g.40379  ORF g.40379 m.40379 type:complete len:416 (-) comp9658_c0_seq1:135-1382(-)
MKQNLVLPPQEADRSDSGMENADRKSPMTPESKNSTLYNEESSVLTLLINACWEGNIDLVNNLLETGDVSLNVGVRAVYKVKWTPLTAACFRGNLDVVRRLIAHGANVDKHSGDCGWSPLTAAAFEGHLDIVKELLDAGADPNKLDGNNEAPLHPAAYNSKLDVVKMLIMRNADLNQLVKGRTAFCEACGHGDFEMAELLAAFGANKMKADSLGNTPRGIARRFHPELVKWLDTSHNWNAIQMAAAGRLPHVARWLLKEGRVDPHNKAPDTPDILELASSPSPYPGIKLIRYPCDSTFRIMQMALQPWSRSTHHLFHKGVRDMVITVFLIAERLWQRSGSPEGDASPVTMRHAKRLKNSSKPEDNHHTKRSKVQQGYGKQLQVRGLPASDPQLPVLPPELWEHVLSFFQRDWWNA